MPAVGAVRSARQRTQRGDIGELLTGVVDNDVDNWMVHRLPISSAFVPCDAS